MTHQKFLFLFQHNEEKRLPQVLKTIRNQYYPRKKIEIIIADAMSTDKTRAIAKKYGCVIIDNPDKHPELGNEKARKISKGEIVFFSAADNAFPDKKWIRKMITPFLEKKDIVGAYCSYGTDSRDFSLNKYISMNSDSFTRFLYGKASNIWELSKYYKIAEKGSNWQIYKLTVQDYPLICLAQGFALKRDYQRTKRSKYDDVLAVLDMLQKGDKIAHVTNTLMIHYSFEDFDNFVKKMDRKVSNSFANTQKWGIVSRDKIYGSRKRSLRKLIWTVYALSFIAPLVYSIKRFIQFRKLYWFYELPVAFAVLALIIKNSLKRYILRSQRGYF